MVVSEEPRKIRKLQYMLECKDFKKALIKRIFNDWAVTLEIHPWALGMSSQDQGLVTVPQGAKLVCDIVPNVFKGIEWNLLCKICTDVVKAETQELRLRGNEIPIPARINTMHLSYSPGFELRAVVVTEHRNIDFGCAEIKPYVKDVLFIQVGVV